MGQRLNIWKASVCLLLYALAVQAASAQGAQYPPADDAWDGTSYRALVERVEVNNLPLPTLADAATKPVFERMVHADNIPLRMGLNRSLAVTLRFQRLNGALPAIHKLVVMYAKETQNGKPYAAELARLMIYECRVSAAVLELSEPYLATLAQDKRFEVHVAYMDQLKADARRLYSGLVQGMTGEARLYAKADILGMIGCALDALPSYHAVIADPDRQDHVHKLTQQIATTVDQKLKRALTELRDMLQHRRLPT